MREKQEMKIFCDGQLQEKKKIFYDKYESTANYILLKFRIRIFAEEDGKLFIWFIIDNAIWCLIWQSLKQIFVCWFIDLRSSGRKIKKNYFNWGEGECWKIAFCDFFYLFSKTDGNSKCLQLWTWRHFYCDIRFMLSELLNRFYLHIQYSSNLPPPPPLTTHSTP